MVVSPMYRRETDGSCAQYHRHDVEILSHPKGFLGALSYTNTNLLVVICGWLDVWLCCIRECNIFQVPVSSIPGNFVQYDRIGLFVCVFYLIFCNVSSEKNATPWKLFFSLAERYDAPNEGYLSLKQLACNHCTWEGERGETCEGGFVLVTWELNLISTSNQDHKWWFTRSLL